MALFLPLIQPDMINQNISHYRITGRLVWCMRRRISPSGVRLRSSPPQLSRDQNALNRFLLEARTASALNHPNICTIYAVENATVDGEPQSFIAMELLAGESVDQKLNTGPPVADPVLDMAIQLDALAAAHASLESLCSSVFFRTLNATIRDSQNQQPTEGGAEGFFRTR